MTAKLIVLAAGGTGGHVFPAEALARVLATSGYRLALVTDRRGTNYRGALSQIETHHLPVSALSGTVSQRLRGGLDLAVSLFQARRLLRRLSPAAVIGFGGYPSLPTMFAALQLRIPTALHEQNAVLGRANRLVAGRVNAIATSFSDVSFMPDNAASRTTLTGNPVRPAVLALRRGGYNSPLADGRLRLLVTGGSQGAAIFSRVVPAAIAALSQEQRARLDIVQQCRPEDIEAVRAAYRTASVNAELDTFFEDLPARLSTASLVICRSGASTVAELTAMGRPAILVPYPHATDDHQTANADALAEAGAGWLIDNARFTASALSERLQMLLADPAPLSRAACAAWRMGRPEAAEQLADIVARLAPANGGSHPMPQEKAA
jgi:UDP-N-acetylglucosamine--N-acetylmuramyl-(pentapeptide) pyrophosphoryl-undecaprenol N-acetylglucosamine transferase